MGLIKGVVEPKLLCYKLLIIALFIVGCATEPEDCAGVAEGDAYYDNCSNCDNDCQIELSNDDLILLSALNNFESKIDNSKILYSASDEDSNIRELGNIVIDNLNDLMWFKTDSTMHFIFQSDNKVINSIELTI